MSGDRTDPSDPTNQYCQPWARQQENYLVSVPREQATRMSPRVQSMLGYSIHPPFMGHVRGVHPRRLLEMHPPLKKGE